MRNFSDVYKAERQKVLTSKKESQIKEYKAIKKALMESFKTKDPNTLPLDLRKSFITTLNECYKKDKGLTSKGKKFLETHVLELNENSTKEQKINYFKRRLNEEVELNLVGSGIKDSIKNIIDEMYKGIKASNVSAVLPTSVIGEIIRYTLLSQVELYMANVCNELNIDLPSDNQSSSEFDKDDDFEEQENVEDVDIEMEEPKEDQEVEDQEEIEDEDINIETETL